MLDRITSNLQLQGEALRLRAERQKVLSGNIANSDTPGYQARDFDFATALRDATGANGPGVMSGTSITSTGHLPMSAATGASPRLGYRQPDQASIDGNTVDMDRERAAFADNTIRYQATLRFINGDVRNMLSAIRGD